MDYVQMFIGLGARPIPQDELVDRGTHFEWTGWTGDATVWLYAPEEGYFEYRGERTNVWFCPQATDAKPLRVVGWYRYPGDPLLYRYVVRDGKQVRQRVTLDYESRMRRSEIGTRVPGLGEHYRRVTYGDLQEQERYCLRLALWNDVRSRRYAFYMPAPTTLDPLPGAWYKGSFATTDAYGWQRLREVRAELGTLVAAADDPESGVEAMNELMARGLRDSANIVEAWNARSSSLDEVVICGCGHVERTGYHHILRGRNTVCDECFNDTDVVVYLENTGEYALLGDGYYHASDDTWRSYPEDEDEDEDEDEEHGLVRDYYMNVLDVLRPDRAITPSPYGDFLMGIELEVVPASSSYHGECVEHTHETLCDEYAVMKHDGSLDDGGFEIVTAPRGLTEHIDRLTHWKPHPKLRAWDPGCCGLHVHISSQAFTPATLGKFIELINAPENDEFILAIAGRHPATDGQAADFAQREGTVVAGNPKKNCQYKDTSRYHMVNTSTLDPGEAARLGVPYSGSKHYNTIELRVFRASLKKERLLAQIEFAHAAVMFCRWSSMRELRQPHFLMWLQQMAGLYPNLAKWFGVKANTYVVVPEPPVRALAEL